MPPSFRHGTWEGPDDVRVWRGILRSLFVVGPDGRLTLVVYDVAPDGMTEAIERAATAD
jgi:peroxiredoxin